MSKKIKILCIFTEVLGNKVWSYRFRDVLDAMEDIEPTYLFIKDEDYRTFAAPYYIKFSSAAESIWVAQEKYRKEIKREDFDILFINGVEFALAFSDLIERYPTILSLDATINQAHEMIVKTNPSLLKRIRSFVYAIAFKWYCRKKLKNVKIFLPFSQWCAGSLMRDLKVDESRIKVVKVGFDLNGWGRIKKERGQKTLLFVGNDFDRKGGPIVLELHQRYFKDKARLIIVTSKKKKFDPDKYLNVEFRQGISYEEVIKSFNEADIFLFPTLKEYFGAVLAEACAAGIPSITRNIGATSELVSNGCSGYVLPYESGEDQWVEKITLLLENDELREKFGRRAREFAEQELTVDKFNRLTLEAVQEIIESGVGA